MTVVPSVPRPQSGADAAARLAIRTIDPPATLFVDAGAGSGKTTALVGRVVELVLAGAELTQIAAITFTEAAAAELRQRVRDALGQARSDPSRTAGEQAVARTAVAEVDHAAICTVHAFAQRILAEFPIQAGLPPVIEVLDEISSSLAFERRWTAFVDRLFDDDESAELLMRSEVAGTRVERYRHLARSFDDNHDRLEGLAWPVAPVRPIDVGPLLRQLDAILLDRRQCTVDDKLADHIDSVVVAVAQHLRGSSDDLDVIEVLAGSKVANGNLGRQDAWPDVKALRSSLAAADATRVELLGDVVTATLAGLGGACAGFTLESAEERRHEGRLEFHDLLVLARRLLRTDGTVRAALHDRYRYLCLDEFQDTDPIQVEIATLIATHAVTAGDTPWYELPVEPGRLFFVGDPKQSIYRFRRADIALYLEARSTFAATPTVLSRNFRTVPAIVEFVNGLFAELIQATDELTQPEFQPLEADRAELGTPCPVILCGGPSEGSASALRHAEAASIAAAIRAAIDEAWVVSSVAGPRAARWSDIAILLPARTSLPWLESALDDVGIPYRAETGSLVWSSREVREVLAVLRAVDDPADELALVAALRSAAFGCSDRELAEFRMAGGRWDHQRSAPEGLAVDHPVVGGLRTLAGYHRERHWWSPSRMVGAVLADLRFFELAYDEARPRDVWRRLRFVLDQARAFGDARGGSLRDFLGWAELQASETSRVVEPVLPEADDDAVRLLTVHGAKGLEFPIVVVSGTTTLPGNRPRAVQVRWRDDHQPPELRFKVGVETAAFAAFVPFDEQADEHERRRLLYVALTRARDHLVVATHHKPQKNESKRSWAELVWTWAGDHPDLWRPGLPPLAPPAALDPPIPLRTDPPVEGELAHTQIGAKDAPNRLWVDAPVEGESTHTPMGTADDDAEVDAAEAAWLAARRAAVLRAATPRTISATALAHGDDRGAAGAGDVGAGDVGAGDDIAGEADPFDPDRPVWVRGRAGTGIGRAVHAVLQDADLAGTDGSAGEEPLAAAARAHAAAHGVADDADEVEALARAALAAPILQTAVAHEHWKEVFVAAPVGERLVEGFIDLLVRTPDGLVVVDYKTDALATDAAVERALASYRWQGAAYALVLEEHLGEPVAGCCFLFLTPNGPRERWVDDLPALVTQLRTELTETLSRSLPE